MGLAAKLLQSSLVARCSVHGLIITTYASAATRGVALFMVATDLHMPDHVSVTITEIFDVASRSVDIPKT